MKRQSLIGEREKKTKLKLFAISCAYNKYFNLIPKFRYLIFDFYTLYLIS